MNIYTDGSCSPNPGIGGWAFIAIRDLGDRYEETRAYGGSSQSTNNEMELTALINAVKIMRKEGIPQDSLTIYSDSSLIINCAMGRFKRNKNLELWKRYDKYSKGLKIEFVWVKAHAGNYYNELVDELANTGRVEYGNKN